MAPAFISFLESFSLANDPKKLHLNEHFTPVKHPNSFPSPTRNTRNHFHNNDTFLSLSLLGWLTLSAMLSLSATAQTLINREWVAQYGLPDTVAWSASTADGSGHLYTTGNTFVPGHGADVLLTRYDPEGNLLWQQTYDHQGQNDYGVAILHHANGELTVAAALHDATDSFDVGLLRYDGSGNLLWSYSYDYEGQYDVPTALAEDALLGTSRRGNPS